MKTSWIVSFVALASCSPSVTGGGSESNFVACKSTSDCPVGLVCRANRCERLEAGMTPSEGGSSTGGDPALGSGSSTETGAGGAIAVRGGAGGRRETAGDASVDGDATSNREAGFHADAQRDGHVDLDASPTEACFDVAPAACGAIAMWSPAPSSNGWSVWRAIPIEGADGFAVLMYHGQLPTADSYAFATLGADGGCAKFAIGPWSDPLRFTGVARAVSRGGTFALVGQCVSRFSCGASTVFLNGAEWADPAGVSYSVDVDVASDGRVLVVSSFPGDSATATDSIERWLSPTGQILAERRFRDFAVHDIEVLDDGTIALAAGRSDGTSLVQFQSATLDPIGAWDAGANRGVTALGEHFPLLAVAGSQKGNSNVWTGILDAQTHGESWTRTRTDLTGLPFALEVDAQGTIDTVVWQGPFGTASYLLLHDAENTPGIATPTFDPNYPPGPARVYPNASIRKEPSGRVLFSTDFAGTYCEKD